MNFKIEMKNKEEFKNLNNRILNCNIIILNQSPGPDK